MTDDELAIRDLIATWLSATEQGAVTQVLELMSPDVVFLLPGQSPMQGREAFAVGLQAALDRATISATSEIQEIHVSGGLAYCWNYLTVTITPRSGAAPHVRQGHVLSIYQKQPGGGWLLTRDANLLASVT